MIRRFFTRVLMVVLIAACGYNWLQMQRLKVQMHALQQQVTLQNLSVQRLNAQRFKTVESPEEAGWLGRAAGEKSLARAARSYWNSAQRETHQGMADLHQLKSLTKSLTKSFIPRRSP